MKGQMGLGAAVVTPPASGGLTTAQKTWLTIGGIGAGLGAGLGAVVTKKRLLGAGIGAAAGALLLPAGYIAIVALGGGGGAGG